MPWADYRKKLEANRRYAATPAGQAARARSHRNYIEKRRAMKDSPTQIDPKPLAQAVGTWRMQ